MIQTDDVYGAIVSYLIENVGGDWFLTREPEQTVNNPRTLPYGVVSGKMDRVQFFEDCFEDKGEMVLEYYAVGDDAARTMGLAVMELFGPSSSWATIPATGFEFKEVSVFHYELSEEDELDRNNNVVCLFEIHLHIESAGSY